MMKKKYIIITLILLIPFMTGVTISISVGILLIKDVLLGLKKEGKVKFLGVFSSDFSFRMPVVRKAKRMEIKFKGA